MFYRYAGLYRIDRRIVQRSTPMLNFEYARIVEQDRRRSVAERIRIERALHPDDAWVNQRSTTTPTNRAGFTPARGAPTTAR